MAPGGRALLQRRQHPRTNLQGPLQSLSAKSWNFLGTIRLSSSRVHSQGIQVPLYHLHRPKGSTVTIHPFNTEVPGPSDVVLAWAL